MSSKHDEPLPREWAEVRFGDVCNQRNEIVQPSGKGKYRFVGLEHVNSGETRIHNHDLDTNVKSSKFRFYAGDLLYGKLRPYLDKAVLTGFGGICSTDLLVLTAQNEKTLAEFLVYVIHSNEFIRHAISTTSGTNHPRTSWKAISKFKFGLPPLPEQRRIAEILTTADTAIQKVDDAIAKTERLKRGLMQELLTKGIGHEEFKDSEVGRIPRGWEVAKVKKVIISYKNGIYKHRKYYGNGYPCIRMYNILNGYINTEDTPLVEVTSQELGEYGLEKGDIVVNRVNTPELVGKAGVVPQNLGKATFESKNIRIRFDATKVFPNFFAIFTQTAKYKIQIRSFAKTAVAQATITQKDLDNLKIPHPPLPEQYRIAEIISTVDKKLELERKRKEKLGRIKKGLMNDLLTGKKRVKP